MYIQDGLSSSNLDLRSDENLTLSSGENQTWIPGEPGEKTLILGEPGKKTLISGEKTLISGENQTLISGENQTLISGEPGENCCADASYLEAGSTLPTEMKKKEGEPTFAWSCSSSLAFLARKMRHQDYQQLTLLNSRLGNPAWMILMDHKHSVHMRRKKKIHPQPTAYSDRKYRV